MVAATAPPYRPAVRTDDDAAFPSSSHHWLPVDAGRSSSSSGAARGCRLPPDVAIATGRAVRFADFSPGTVPPPPRVQRPGVPRDDVRTESLAEGLGRAVSRAVSSCVGADDGTTASAAGDGRDDHESFRFDLEGLEVLLNCVPLEYDPRSPRSRAAQDQAGGRDGAGDGCVDDGALRDEAEWRLSVERDAVLSGAADLFGATAGRGDASGGGSLLQLAGGGRRPPARS